MSRSAAPSDEPELVLAPKIDVSLRMHAAKATIAGCEVAIAVLERTREDARAELMELEDLFDELTMADELGVRRVRRRRG